jgi:hypothetical protein
MRANHLRLSLAAAAVAALAGACGDDLTHHDDVDAAAGPDAAATAPVTLAFAHQVGGSPMAIATSSTDTPYTDAAGDRFGVTVLKYFISDVELTYADGGTWRVPGAHYVDHDVAPTRTYALGDDAPVGALTSMSFVMGLRPALNVTGAFTQPPESLMEWPVMMGGGYHFMKFEGWYVNAAGQPFQFRAHSGALMGIDYSFPVTLDATGHAIAAGGTTLGLAMNLEEWFAHPDTWDLDAYFNAGHPGIMGDAAAQASLERNGADVFTLGAP